ncbi:MAG: hypothetical protein A2Y25_07200 [Candidatus Melainabacteria bacterium GWF2_37_15]|nr:MAG: hypothetical protein A2Y25_07200 [Candidatus Melainabacteria bacterium GWF2_37_15]
MNSKIMPVVDKIVKDSGLILVEEDFVKEAGKWTLKIFIYNPEKPITHENCENVTRKLSEHLDEIITVPYYLEVSSPGIDRKLKSEREYHIFKGKRAKIKLKTGKIYISEINDEVIKKYINNEISYTKLDPEYNL